MKCDLAGATHTGKVRANNQDAYALIPPHAAILADGMGGLARGREAADLVISTLLAALGEGEHPEQGLLRAHQRITEASVAGRAGSMGSTAVVLTLADSIAMIHWVGDSRAYLWRENSLRQLTRDHSLVQDLIDSGALDPQRAETHPNRHVLTRAVGVRDRDDLSVDSVRLTLQPGDRLLLCSDGLHGFLPRQQIIDCLAAGGTAAAIVETLIECTMETTQAGDNITVIAAVVGD